MRLQIEPSEIIVILDGVECRVWNGITEDDKQVLVFVHRIASREEIENFIERPGPLECMNSERAR